MREDEIGDACNMRGNEECAQKFGWEAEGKMPLRISGRKREDNIEIDLRERGLKSVNWIHLA
jgi:hypothetical protein